MGAYTGRCGCHCANCCAHVGQQVAPNTPPPLVLTAEEAATVQRDVYGGRQRDDV